MSEKDNFNVIKSLEGVAGSKIFPSLLNWSCSYEITEKLGYKGRRGRRSSITVTRYIKKISPVIETSRQKREIWGKGKKKKIERALPCYRFVLSKLFIKFHEERGIKINENEKIKLEFILDNKNHRKYITKHCDENMRIRQFMQDLVYYVANKKAENMLISKGIIIGLSKVEKIEVRKCLYKIIYDIKDLNYNQKIHLVGMLKMLIGREI